MSITARVDKTFKGKPLKLSRGLNTFGRKIILKDLVNITLEVGLYKIFN